MEEVILKAQLRTDSPKKVRLEGFIPGVLNQSDLTSTSVQFEKTSLNKIVSMHGSNAKIYVEIGNDKKFGFIKEIQKNPLDRKIIHIAIQLVSKDQEVKMMIPILFHGREEIEHRLLQIQVMKAEIEVTGKPASMPDSVIVDVSKMEAGDTVTASLMNLPAEIKVHDAADEIYAVIKIPKEVVEEEPIVGEVEAAATAAAAEVTPA